MLRTVKLAAVVTLFTLAGCAENAIKENKTTFLSADDLVAMTDKMARELAADSKVAQIPGPLTIVIKPVINETNEILRDGQAEMFVLRVETALAKHPELRSRFVFVINRDDYNKLRKEEVGDYPSEDRIVPGYALYAKFQVDTHVSSQARSDSYLCTYFLTRINGANTGEQVWSGDYETHKHEKKQFLD